ncbi:Os06g0726400, partial [Oryza sativa Japonica Group]
GRLCGHFSRWRVSSRSVGCGTCGLQVLSVVLAAAGPAGIVGRRRPLGCWVARCVLAGSEDGFRVLGESSVRLIAGLTAMNVLGHHAMPLLEASSQEHLQ